MLDVAHMGRHVALMTGTDAMRTCFDLVTDAPARIMGLNVGLRIGARGSPIVPACANRIDALRLRLARLAVISDGVVVARARPALTEALPLGVKGARFRADGP